MLMTMKIILIISLLLFIFFNTLFLISKHNKKNREKTSPFECGFDPFYNARMSFSIHFFVVMIMFLIFDIEIVIIMPSSLTMNLPLINWMCTLTILFMILILGMFMEWKEGCMNWL
uniref:NADH-ubiquinone oxidoreductase chain 3 n=1 Tax=Pseudophacopteron sp. DMP-2018 TaxID=2908812 RepID=A0A344A2P0_9HEMI|nr:NADH dehydrogenase subunit 3 [Pseudophacopteron sp. DMP-2018]